jgi:hypothetical protein
MQDALPLPTIEDLFGRLGLVYGKSFLEQYVGYNLQAVKVNWAETLAGLHTEAIEWAMDRLPEERPPNALAFRRLCMQYPEPAQPPAPPTGPRPVPAHVRSKVAQLAIPLVDNRPEDVKIAYRILYRHRNEGVRLTRTQREWVKHARAIVNDWEAHLARQEESSAA